MRPEDRGNVLDTARPGSQAAGMTENPYAIPVDDLEATARVPRAAQVEEQAEPPVVAPDRSNPLAFYGGDAAGDADGD